MDGWLEDSWLVAIYEAVPAEDVRRWWNSKDTEVLDDLIAAAPGFRLGTTVTTGVDPEPPGPVRRVHDLLVLRGTLPGDFRPNPPAPYVLPVLDDELHAAILGAFAPRSADHAVMEAAPVADLAGFLDKHPGAQLSTRTATEEPALVPIADGVAPQEQVRRQQH
jgi:hypothetical protein